MGLDIRAYAGLVPSDRGVYRDGDIVSPETGQLVPDLTSFYQHPVYKAWNQTVQHQQVYSYFDELAFRAGSYTGYSGFRNWLEDLAVGPDENCEPGDPFYELVIFSDCEGTIDSIVAQKLHRDFVLHDHKARTSKFADWYYPTYCDFTNAFRIASVSGAVRFC